VIVLNRCPDCAGLPSFRLARGTARADDKMLLTCRDCGRRSVSVLAYRATPSGLRRDPTAHKRVAAEWNRLGHAS
jgi:hypothetical protein